MKKKKQSMNSIICASQLALVVKNLLANADVRDVKDRSLLWKIPRSRKRQSTPVFLPGTFPGQRSLAGHSQWAAKCRT